MITLYGMSVSGNCWKPLQMLRLIGADFRFVEVDGNAGETRTPEFLARNPNGKIPVAVLADGTVLVESNAMTAHFAEGTAWLPAPGLPRTRVFEWLFFEQYSHEPYIAVARNIITYRREKHLFPERIAQCHAAGAKALDVMETRLARHDWLTDAGPTIADITLYAYTHVADEGEFDLARWPGVSAWVSRFGALPGIVPLREA